MSNEGVKCNVEECLYHASHDKCSLPTIMVTHEHTTSEGVAIPHFCKSYEKK